MLDDVFLYKTIKTHRQGSLCLKEVVNREVGGWYLSKIFTFFHLYYKNYNFSHIWMSVSKKKS